MQRRGHKMGAVFSTTELQSLGVCFSEHRFLPHGPAAHSSLKSALLYSISSHSSLRPHRFLFSLHLVLRFWGFHQNLPPLSFLFLFLTLLLLRAYISTSVPLPFRPRLQFSGKIHSFHCPKCFHLMFTSLSAFYCSIS